MSIDSEEIAEDVRIEYDKAGEILSIEIHNVAKMVAKSLATRLKETAI